MNNAWRSLMGFSWRPKKKSALWYARMRRNAAGRRVRRPLVARRETRERIGKRKRTPLWQGPALSLGRRNTDRPQFETAANSLENRYRYALRYGWQDRSGTSGDRNMGDAGGNAAASRPGEVRASFEFRPSQREPTAVVSPVRYAQSLLRRIEQLVGQLMEIVERGAAVAATSSISGASPSGFLP